MVFKTVSNKKTARAAGVVLLTLLLLGLGASGKFVAFPLTLVIEALPGETKTGSFFVVNTGEEPEEITITLADWRLKPDGSIEFLEAGSLEYSLTPFVEFAPISFPLEPTQKQEVRYTLSLPADLPIGDLWAIFLVEGSQVEGVGGTEGEVETEIGVRVRYAIKIFLSDPRAEKDGRISGMRLLGVNPLHLVVVFENTGTAVLRGVTGWVEVRNERGETVKTLEVKRFTVLRGVRRELELREPEGFEPLPSGFYVALAVLDFGAEFLVAAELPFEVP